MARERSVRLKCFSVRLPLHYEPALGKLNDPDSRLLLGVVGYLMREAIKPIYDLFSPDEWNLFASALESQMDDLRIPPETPAPGAVLASLVESGLGPVDANGAGEKSKGKSVCERLQELSVVQAWAVYVAVRFWFDKKDYVQEGMRWWELPVRVEIIRARDEAEGEDE